MTLIQRFKEYISKLTVRDIVWLCVYIVAAWILIEHPLKHLVIITL